MHADGGDGNQLPDFIQVPAKRCVGFVGIPAGQGQVFIMVPDFMAEPVNFPDDGFIIAFGNDAEIVAAADASFMFQLRGCQRIARQTVNIMPEDHGFFT